MRNPFDQYLNPENRLTHALLTCLSMDSRVLRRFVLWANCDAPPAARLEVLEQSLPGRELDVSEEDAERRGLPDGCITDGAGWGLLIESKFAAAVSADQLCRHLRTAARHGLDKPILLLLTVGEVKQWLPAEVTVRRWSEVYSWLIRERSRSVWARLAAEYLEVAEARGVEQEYLQEGALTVFTGIPFRLKDPYTYSQAKRLLGLLLEELRKDKRLQRELGADPESKGRGAITGRTAQGVWDFISLKSSARSQVFTRHPHLTVGIRDSRLEVYVTIPNGVAAHVRRGILGESLEDFEALIGKVTGLLGAALRRYPGATPMIVVVQRRYPTQRSPAIIDANLRFDPRTAFPDSRRVARGVKLQPQWLSVTYGLLKNRQSNLQFQIGADFSYEQCQVVATAGVREAAVEVWLACKPLLEAVRGGA